MVISEEQILDRLNPSQREAVTARGAPLLVLAGPGSGKTRVITHRIAYFVGPLGVPAASVLAVTFTNKAAREMLERLQVLVPGVSQSLTVGTFHAICARILRRDGAPVGVEPNFTIADDDDQIAVVRHVLKDLDLDEKRYPPRGFLSQISAAKSSLIGPEEYRRVADSYFEEQAAVVYSHYQEALQAGNLLDFDDLLARTAGLFREHPKVLDRYQSRYRNVLVDEFQDTNQAQYALVRLLGRGTPDVCVVGDEDQSIYSWRQADIRNILNFEQDFRDARTIVLDQNYRCTRTILQAARAMIAPNTQRKDKKLFTENEVGERIVVFEAFDENEEANYAASQIERLRASQGIRFADVAVMYRTNSQSRVLERTFLRHRIPHKVVGMRFYERREVRDLLAYLRLIHNPKDVTSFDRIVNVPARSIGAKTIADLRAWAARLGVTPPEAVQLLADGEPTAVPCPLPSRSKEALASFGRTMAALRRLAAEVTVGQLLDKVIAHTGYLEYLRDGGPDAENRAENVRELITVAEEFSHQGAEGSLAAFLEDAALAADADEYDESADAVTLITLHAAKGLEFGVVFIVGMEEGICPHSRSLDNPDQLEEERRLLYVGMTRARRRLYLTYTAHRTQYGDAAPRQPSRYFDDLPRELVQGTAPAIQVKRRDPSGNGALSGFGPRVNGVTAPRAPVFRPIGPEPAPVKPVASAQRLRPGQRVLHAKFGEGTVVGVEARGDDQEVSVAFPDLGVKRLLASYANLILK
jgi:DNA helicase-2/ATP-dependent DNA helicase PcrA